MKDINIRHDRSGTYPQSTLDYPAESWSVDVARAPLDSKYDHCVDLLCSSGEPMDLSFS